ncbi:MAG: hypothetical protein CFE43_20385 [Burkholderiales bacterium PBB3]|nr:MAG: hypothetical protein CFE43_20385 [Burkholderiales bacterium PBB3]
MKKLILLLAIIGAAFYFYQQKKQSALDPEVIANPTFAEIRMTLDARGRTFEQVFFAKTVDDADCKKYSKNVIDDLQKKQANDSAGHWLVKSSECKPELTPRYAKLFDNEPTFVTYLSMARSDRRERETRLLYWGVSVEESDKVCDGVSKMQNGRKGAVTCIRAVRQ